MEWGTVRSRHDATGAQEKARGSKEEMIPRRERRRKAAGSCGLSSATYGGWRRVRGERPGVQGYVCACRVMRQSKVMGGCGLAPPWLCAAPSVNI